MAQQLEIVSRFHKLIEGDGYKDLGWAEQLQEAMKERHLMAGTKPVCPVLRPHFLSRRQYTTLGRATSTLASAVTRIQQMAFTTPALLNRIEMLPAEKLLAAMEPGYQTTSVASMMDAHVNNGTLRLSQFHADAPFGVVYGELLAKVFLDSKPMKELRKKYSFTHEGSANGLLKSVLAAWKEFGGKAKQPAIGILEMKNPFQTMESGELQLLVELFEKAGYRAKVVSPDTLEYRNGALSSAGFPIQVIYRRMKVQEFLIRYDLDHPLVKAYRDRAVCVVNSFRSEISEKKALLELLTDQAVTAKFPAAERKAIAEYLPWTRLVGAKSTTVADQTVDLPEYIRSNRERLVLRPNDDLDTEQPQFFGAQMDENAWDRAIRTAMRNGYVVQEATPADEDLFPLYRFGMLEMRRMQINVRPQMWQGELQGCGAWLNSSGGFSTVAGLAPVFVVDQK